MTMDVNVVDYRCIAQRGDRPFEERHQRACISFVWSGSFGYRVGTRRATLGPGAVMLGNAGAPYVCSHEDVGGDRCLSVSYDRATLAHVAEAIGIVDLDAPFRLPALPPLAHAGGYAYALTAALRGAIAWSAEEVALELAAWTLREQTGRGGAWRPAEPSAHDRRRAVDAMLYLDERSGEALTLADVARVAELSPFHFLRTFRTTVGVTPHQYLVRRRLVQAAALLLDTDAPITAIAFDVGFNDLAHFIRSFGRAFGCAPRAFRRAGGLPATGARNAKSGHGASAR
jgi:AraC-like DNA-binding protein